MFGTGSISLKENKRERNQFPTKEITNSIYTNPLVFRKSSKEVCKKAAKRLRSLKIREFETEN